MFNETFFWDDIPETVNPIDFLQHMVEADSKPGDARKRAYSNLRYALKKRWIGYAPPPHPEGQVFTLSFFRWLQGLPKHNVCITVSGIPISLRLGMPTCFQSDPLPLEPAVPLRLESENRWLKEKNRGIGNATPSGLSFPRKFVFQEMGYNAP